MNTTPYLAVIVSLPVLMGCVTALPASGVPAQPFSPARMLCEKGNHHAAMRELPKAMTAWEEYTRRTGNTCEGAASFLYAIVMFTIAEKGDAHWGRILDDPQIPYEYKTGMICEILEARLGKGAVYVADKKNFIVPRSGPIDLRKLTAER